MWSIWLITVNMVNVVTFTSKELSTKKNFHDRNLNYFLFLEVVFKQKNLILSRKTLKLTTLTILTILRTLFILFYLFIM